MDRLHFSEPLGETLRRRPVQIIVTGAGGWLGQAALEMLEGALGDAMPDRVTVFASSPRVVKLRSGRRLTARGFAELAHAEAPPSLILHFAFRTRGFAREPGYAETNRAITRTLKTFILRNGASGIFVPSSGAIYGAGGVPDTDIARNPYGMLKYEDEVIFGELARMLSFPAAIIRIFNLSGALMNNLNGYALASILADVARGGPVTLRAAHPVFRAYTHVEDVLNIAMAILLRGLAPGVFDTAGEPALELGQLALRASRLLAGRELPILRPDWEGGTEDRYLGDLAAYQNIATCAGIPLQPLDTQITRTAQYLHSLEGMT